MQKTKRGGRLLSPRIFPVGLEVMIGRSGLARESEEAATRRESYPCITFCATPLTSRSGGKSVIAPWMIDFWSDCLDLAGRGEEKKFRAL
jgi:hypothetical protein